MQVARRDEQARSEPAVDERADRAPLRAQVDATRRAPHAVAAGREVRLGHDARTAPPRIHSVPELGDDAGDLVPHRHRRPRRILAVLDVQVGAADPGGGDVEHDVTGHHAAARRARRARRCRAPAPASSRRAQELLDLVCRRHLVGAAEPRRDERAGRVREAKRALELPAREQRRDRAHRRRHPRRRARSRPRRRSAARRRPRRRASRARPPARASRSSSSTCRRRLSPSTAHSSRLPTSTVASDAASR